APATNLLVTTGSSVTIAPATNLGATIIYTVTGTTNGCSGTATTSVTIFAAPASMAMGNDTTICAGSFANLAAAPGATPGIGTGFSDAFSWTPATGVTDPTNENTTADPASTITYTATFTNQNGCSISGTQA